MVFFFLGLFVLLDPDPYSQCDPDSIRPTKIIADPDPQNTGHMSFVTSLCVRLFMLLFLLQSLYQGLQEMLNYEGDDFQEVFLQPFQISYTGTYP